MPRPTWRCRCLRSALCCSDVTKCAKQRCTIFSSAGNEIKFCTRLFLSFSRFSALAFPGCYVFSPRSREKRICGVLLYRVYAKATVARCIVVRSPPCRSSKRVDGKRKWSVARHFIFTAAAGLLRWRWNQEDTWKL